MKINNFYGKTLEEAIEKVKEELGNNAIIIHEKKIQPKGLFKAFKKPTYKVVAAKDNKALKPKAEKIEDKKVKEVELKEDNFLNLLNKENINPQNKEVKTYTKNPPKTHEKPNKQSNDDLDSIKDIKEIINTMVSNLSSENFPNYLKGVYNKSIISVYFKLKKQGISEDNLESMFDYLKKELKDFNKPAINETIIANLLAKYLDINIPNKKEMKKVVFFVGPTGVGKTTTIAKLAAKYSLSRSEEVGFISSDTYRIAAVEQLKTYAKILNITTEVIYEASELQEAIKNLENKDKIFIDTAGRSHKNDEQVGEIKNLINHVDEKQVFITLSATSKYEDIKEIVDRYDFLDDYVFIFSKVDEVNSIGPLINIIIDKKKPVFYITNGQNVPEDIVSVTNKDLIDILLKEA